MNCRVPKRSNGPGRRVARRRGSLLLEAAIAATLLAAVLIGLVQLGTLVARQQRSVAQRQFAIQAATNVMESIAARPWDQTSAEQLAELTLPPEQAERLSQARLEIEVVDNEVVDSAAAEDADAGLAARRFHVRLDWINSAGIRVAPVELTAWRFQPPDRTPAPEPESDL